MGTSREYTPEEVIRAALKTHPQLKDNIFGLIDELGIRGAADFLLMPEQSQNISGQNQTFGSFKMPMTTPKIPQAKQARIDVPRQNIQRPVNPVGLGSQMQQSVETRATERPEVSIPTPEISGQTQPAIEPQAATSAPASTSEAMPSLEPEKEIEPSPQAMPIDMMPVFGPIAIPYIPPRAYTKGTEELGRLCSGYGFKIPLVLAMIKHESNFNPNAMSSDKAKGLLQLMPDTAREMGLVVSTKLDERELPKKSISAGLKYMKWLKDNFAIKNVDELLAAYNAGPGRLKDEKWKKIRETSLYVTKVKQSIEDYKSNPETMAADLVKLFRATGNFNE